MGGIGSDSLQLQPSLPRKLVLDPTGGGNKGPNGNDETGNDETKWDDFVRDVEISAPGGLILI